MARKKTERKSGGRPARRQDVVAPAEEAVLEEVDTGGAGVDEGIVFATFFFLAGAVTLMWIIVSGRYPVA